LLIELGGVSTDPTQLNQQTADQAFGPLEDANDQERYQLQSSFSLAGNAAAFALTKSMLLYQEDLNDPTLLNIAALPIENNSLAGFPIKFILYRGIEKSALVGTNGLIQQADGSWDGNNILDVIKKFQDGINEDNETNIAADTTHLGLQIKTNPNETLLESILLDYTDDYQPMIVTGGCQIGKFRGGSTVGSIQLVLDRIGEEATLGLLRSTESILKVSPLETIGVTEKELTVNRFNHRTAKEKILAYMDITAFYGSCINQGIRVPEIGGQSALKNILQKFHNHKAVYIDVRDERGFSQNHFLRFVDRVLVGFLDGSGKTPNYGDPIDYYEGWPILILRNRQYQTTKKFFYLKLPILFGMPENANILTAFNKGVSSGPNKRSKRYILLNKQGKDGTVSSGETDPIRLKNWEYSDYSLGANHFLLKLDRIQELPDRSQVYHKIWNSFFPLHMKAIFNQETFEDGEFRVKTYSALNAPLLTSKDYSEVYFPTIGIAFDKYQVTFFSFYDERAAIEYPDTEEYVPKPIDTGKFDYTVDVNELEYSGNNQAIGFLYQLANNERIQDYQLTKRKYTVTHEDSSEEQIDLLYYQKTGESTRFDNFMDQFEAISFNLSEYNTLVNASTDPVTEEGFINGHPMYLLSKDIKFGGPYQMRTMELTVSLGMPKLIPRADGTYAIYLATYPKPIKISEEEITLRAALNE
ncbi:MAG: hypothetical protein AAFQ98_02305, partial [Bacteroidota bacterium]